MSKSETTLSTRVSNHMRKRRAEMIMVLIHDSYLTNGHCRILDIGGVVSYWTHIEREFFTAHRAHVTLCVGSWEKRQSADPALFTIEYGDGCNLKYADDTFDLVHSNSVIEHVGDWANMQQFAYEVQRLAPAYYVQTPSFWFPYEPHFGSPVFHWLPESTRVSLLKRRAMGHYPKAENVSKATEWAQSAHLLDFQQMRSLFPDADVRREKFFGFTKSLIAVREASGV